MACNHSHVDGKTDSWYCLGCGRTGSPAVLASLQAAAARFPFGWEVEALRKMERATGHLQGIRSLIGL